MSENNDSDNITIKVPSFVKKTRENPWIVSTIVLGILVVALVVFGTSAGVEIDGRGVISDNFTFSSTGDNLCTDSSGKPYVILFSTTTCPHCIWVGDTFDSLINSEHADELNIQHWNLDTGDNTLTSQVEGQVPSDIMQIYSRYDPQGYVPAYVFGCEYSRIGNGYEREDNLDAEYGEFEKVIEEILD